MPGSDSPLVRSEVRHSDDGPVSTHTQAEAPLAAVTASATCLSSIYPDGAYIRSIMRFDAVATPTTRAAQHPPCAAVVPQSNRAVASEQTYDVTRKYLSTNDLEQPGSCAGCAEMSCRVVRGSLSVGWRDLRCTVLVPLFGDG